MRVIKEENGLPVKMWLQDIEDKALEQAKNLARLPFAYHHIAIMPDAHTGYGMPIGGVMATRDVIVPNAVGVDIGCGMLAVKTEVLATDVMDATFRKWMGEIRQAIPMGKNSHDEAQTSWEEPDQRTMPICWRNQTGAGRQLGTLGGGNHFIEFQRGIRDDHLWIMLHSGSRNLGYKVGNYYNKLAKAMNYLWFSSVPKEWDLAYLPDISDEGRRYLAEMQYCVRYAQQNREVMMKAIMDIVNLPIRSTISAVHNYVEKERHYNTNVWVHRKGAIRARADEIGIIPGCQGTQSYITVGKGNKESFCSSSHGAGRTMSRKKAKETLVLTEELERMGTVIHGMRNAGDLDEAPGAYKDIAEVMENQADLTEMLDILCPIAVLKG